MSVVRPHSDRLFVVSLDYHSHHQLPSTESRQGGELLLLALGVLVRVVARPKHAAQPDQSNPVLNAPYKESLGPSSTPDIPQVRFLSLPSRSSNRQILIPIPLLTPRRIARPLQSSCKIRSHDGHIIRKASDRLEEFPKEHKDAIELDRESD